MWTLFSQYILFIIYSDDDINWPICRVEFADKDEKLKIVKACAEQKKFPLKLNLTVEEIKKEVDGLKSKDFDDGVSGADIFIHPHIPLYYCLGTLSSIFLHLVLCKMPIWTNEYVGGRWKSGHGQVWWVL